MSDRRKKQKSLITARITAARMKHKKKRNPEIPTIDERTEMSIEVLRDVSVPRCSNDFADSLKLIRKQLKPQKLALALNSVKKKCETDQKERKSNTHMHLNVSPISAGRAGDIHFVSADELDYERLAFDTIPVMTSTPVKEVFAIRSEGKEEEICPEIVPEVVLPLEAVMPLEDIGRVDTDNYQMEIEKEAGPQACNEAVSGRQKSPNSPKRISGSQKASLELTPGSQKASLERILWLRKVSPKRIQESPQTSPEKRPRFPKTGRKRIRKLSPGKVLVRKQNTKAPSNKKPSDYPQCPLETLYYS